jgi:hypothetical protein
MRSRDALKSATMARTLIDARIVEPEGHLTERAPDEYEANE